jgi:hypothetical protein
MEAALSVSFRTFESYYDKPLIGALGRCTRYRPYSAVLAALCSAVPGWET